LIPLPEGPDERVRPYLGEPLLSEGISGDLLGPWQRFDTMHYLRIAREGYASEADSVFPPLYPLGMRLVGFFFTGFLTVGASHLLGGLVLSNLACIGLFVLLYRVTAEILDERSAKRTVLSASCWTVFAPTSCIRMDSGPTSSIARSLGAAALAPLPPCMVSRELDTARVSTPGCSEPRSANSTR
jgi:hypothetical protein